MGLESARTAAQACLETQIEIVDSGTAVGAYGFVVLAAARAATDGNPPHSVVAAAEKVKSKVTMIGALDTLRYLEKGGRMGKAAYWAGSALNIKPIIEIPTSSGVVEPLERVRSRPKALRRLSD